MLAAMNPRSFHGITSLVAAAGLLACERSKPVVENQPDPAAEKRAVEAHYIRGLAHLQGDGVPKNPVEAAKCFRTAAEQGDARAQFNLGLLYKSGEGVPRVPAEAAAWFQKAADQGDDRAQCSLSAMLVTGEGVPKDLPRAYMYLNLASATNPKAAEARALVEKTMTVKQLAEGQRLSRDWKPTESSR
jgi:uncharacterized protein